VQSAEDEEEDFEKEDVEVEEEDFEKEDVATCYFYVLH